MTRTAVGKLCKKHWVVLGFLPVAVKAPTHVYHLRVLIYGFLAEVTVAILTVETGGNVRPVDKMHKVRYLRDRYPVDGLVIFYVFSKFG
jgi:hypothetical protein